MKPPRILFTTVVALGMASGSALAQTTNITSSTLEYSGTQGANGWNYGYYNRTTDGDALYSGAEFQNLPSNGGGGYALGGNPPWTGIFNNVNGHPNSVGNGGEHWIVRRYTVGAGEGGAAFDINWLIRKSNPNCGDGITGYIYHNGTQIDTSTIAFDNSTGALRKAIIPLVNTGDTIDLMLSPNDPNNDGCDGSDFFMDINRRNVYSGITTTLFADSVADFGQNTNGWTYGMYDITANGSPGPGEFQPFASSVWNGTSWDVNPAAAGPWTEISATGGHPNGTNSGGVEHWATRRYTIQPGEDGNVIVDWEILKANTGGGAGTSVHILWNGVEVASTGVQGFDGLGFSGSLALPGTQVGDTIDIALAPQGLDAQLFGAGDNSDGADGSNFSMRISTVPEPATAGIMLLALGVLNRRRRRSARETF